MPALCTTHLQLHFQAGCTPLIEILLQWLSAFPPSPDVAFFHEDSVFADTPNPPGGCRVGRLGCRSGCSTSRSGGKTRLLLQMRHRPSFCRCLRFWASTRHCRLLLGSMARVDSAFATRLVTLGMCIQKNPHDAWAPAFYLYLYWYLYACAYSYLYLDSKVCWYLQLCMQLWMKM